MASGLIVGFALGTGGMAVTLLGCIADAYGVPAVLWISALLPVLGFATATFLPAVQEKL
jgi:FSR family fosmidomycin resistance protein-like MFS transporter